ncbi:concanavalin A-like lectin/glucanase domain-containing protein [Abortiporus biennis]|nr:concanavalin A-like lectin/glucanase domain-containing protein [Abortiporus biennis]
MRTGYAYLFIILNTILTQCAASTRFVLKDSYVGWDFFNGWNWETFDDPTHGRVDYVDKNTAMQQNLSYDSEGSTFVMRADSTKFVAADERGRRSVRISSRNAYDESLIILDLQHMPEGCTTWPAFWTISQQGPWPEGGEIDIIEGVNKQQTNQATLHTSSSCTMPDDRFESGAVTATNCDVKANYNEGCGVSFDNTNSYGSEFNRQGGGWYAVSRTRAKGVQIWFWSRNDPTVPNEVRGLRSLSVLGSQTSIVPDHVNWGKPDASFPLQTDNCDYDAHFNAHILVFDLTFCGDWAGADSVYGSSGCPGNLVNNNPEEFKQAYWEINSLKVYTPSIL